MEPKVDKITNVIYTLNSSARLDAVGFVTWLRVMYKTAPNTAIKIFRSAYEALPEHIMEKVLTDEVHPTVDGDKLIIHYSKVE